jgi:hypothetical protein
MTSLPRAAVVAVGVASILAGMALILINLPAGRGLVIVGCVGLALTLSAKR